MHLYRHGDIKELELPAAIIAFGGLRRYLNSRCSTDYKDLHVKIVLIINISRRICYSCTSEPICSFIATDFEVIIQPTSTKNAMKLLYTGSWNPMPH
jgi:hypothetical protein